MTKSHVSLEQKVCVVCGHPYDTNAILLDTHLRERFERHTVTGSGLCPEHHKLFKEGYIALVGVDPVASKPTKSNTLTQEQAYRTGRIAYIKRPVFAEIYQKPIEELAEMPMVFVEDKVIDILQAIPVKKEGDDVVAE